MTEITEMTGHHGGQDSGERVERSGNRKVKIVKRKVISKGSVGSENYKWPYYDSYTPNVGMNTQDKKIVRSGIQKQYFPNEQGTFNVTELKNRKKGIKKIEDQYAERVKTGTGDGGRNKFNATTSLVLSQGKTRGLFKQELRTPNKVQFRNKIYQSVETKIGAEQMFMSP